LSAKKFAFEHQDGKWYTQINKGCLGGGLTSVVLGKGGEGGKVKWIKLVLLFSMEWLLVWG